MNIRKSILQHMAAWFGEKSLAAQALAQEQALGGECVFTLEDRRFTVERVG